MNFNEMCNNVKLYENFRKEWSLERIKNLTIDEYTKVNSKSTFTYYIEHKTNELGKIGVSSSFIYGIYEQENQKNKETKTSIYNGKYAWKKKFGNNEKEAFENVKNEIIKIIINVQDGNFAAIDESKIDAMYRWKIAFLYQNQKHPMITPVYTQAILEWDIERKAVNINNPSRSQLYTTISKYEKFADIEDALTYSEYLMEDYRETHSSDYDAKSEKKFIKKLSGKQKRNATSSAEYVEYVVKEHKTIRRNPHNKLEKSFKEYLINVIKANNILQDSDFIDYQFDLNNKKYICELKPSSDIKEIKYAIQGAIGQILRYSYDKDFDYKIIVFQNEPDEENLKFIEYLKNQHNLYYLYEKSFGKFYGNILNEL